MPTTVEVRGLAAAAKNLALIGKVGATELSREALRDGAQVINQRVKAATYTSFIKRTGAIRAGFGVRVAKALKGTELLSFIVQHETAIALRPRKKRSRKPQPKAGIAFWWRYLEFGTGPRKSVKKPRGKRPPKEGSRAAKALARYAAAASRGQITARKWIRPAFSASAESAIQTFDGSFRRRLEAEVSKLPKT